MTLLEPAQRAPALFGDPTAPNAFPARRPNTVCVLSDDLALNRARHLPPVLAMLKVGVAVADNFVTDLLSLTSTHAELGRFDHCAARDCLRRLTSASDNPETAAISCRDRSCARYRSKYSTMFPP